MGASKHIVGTESGREVERGGERIGRGWGRVRVGRERESKRKRWRKRTEEGEGREGKMRRVGSEENYVREGKRERERRTEE